MLPFKTLCQVLRSSNFPSLGGEVAQAQEARLMELQRLVDFFAYQNLHAPEHRHRQFIFYR